MYQLVTQDCTSQDGNYNGTWYCAKVEVCESYMSSARECIVSRGCAKEEQCTYDNAGTLKTMNNYKVVDSDGQKPAGMAIITTCCKASKFPTDDTVAVDYADVSRVASRQNRQFTLVSR
jgi:hypothetical protein